MPNKFEAVPEILLRCPFCGSVPEIIPWHGAEHAFSCPQRSYLMDEYACTCNARLKRRIRCSDESCPVEPSVCGSTEAKAIAKWNHRASSRPPFVSDLEELVAEWRESAKDDSDDGTFEGAHVTRQVNRTLNDCADELEKILGDKK